MTKPIPNFTKKVIEQVLKDNEGFVKGTDSSRGSFKCYNQYMIKGGQMFRREYGKDMNGQFDNMFECTLEETRKILNKFLGDLNLDGVRRS